MSIYITGDTHGTYDAWKLGREGLARQRIRPEPDDVLIICGDSGCCWSGFHHDDMVLAKYAEAGWTTCFIDGNHENFDILESFPLTDFMGGKARIVERGGPFARILECPSAIHLPRGQYYDMGGTTLWTFGGASSVDRQWRIEGESWWPREMPSDEEMEEGLASLAARGNQVDLIVTHDCPTGLLVNLYSHHSAFGPDKANDYLQKVANTVDFKCWCFGHHHVDKSDFKDRRFHAMFDRVSLLDDLMER